MPDDDLRTALTKLADEMWPDSRYRWASDRIRALLAAHPAPETRIDSERMTPHVEADPDSPHGTRMVWTAPPVVDEAEIAARALDEAADAQDADPEFRDPLRLKSDWLRTRAARLRGATRGDAS